MKQKVKVDAKDLAAQSAALSDTLCRLRKDNLELKAHCEVAFQSCNLTHAVFSSYVFYMQQHQTLASLLAMPGDHDSVLSALEGQAQQLVQELGSPSLSTPTANPHPTAAAPAAPAAARNTPAAPAVEPCQQGMADCPLHWQMPPSRFLQDVMGAVDWSAPRLNPLEHRETFSTIYRSLEPMLQTCQQAHDGPAAAAADGALRSWFTQFMAFALRAYLLWPHEVANHLSCDDVPAEHLQHITRAAHLSAEQLQQVALLHGAFKQLSQPYAWLRQQLQLLLSTTEQSLAQMLGGQGSTLLATPPERLVRALLAATQHSSTQNGSRMLVMEAVQAIAAAAAAAAPAAAPALAAPAAAAPAFDRSNSTMPGGSSSQCPSATKPCSVIPAAPAAALGSAAATARAVPGRPTAAGLAAPITVPGLCPQAEGIHMTPELGEQLSRLLVRVMRKMAWLECCFGILLICLLPLQQLAAAIAATPPYPFDPVAWVAHVAAQVQQQQQQPQEQQQQHSHQKGHLEMDQPMGLDTGGAGHRDSGSSAAEALPPSSSSCVAPAGGAGPAGLQADVDQLCQALRGVYLNPGPAARAQLREATAAYGSRRVPRVSIAAESDPVHIQQPQVAQQPAGTFSVSPVAAGVVDEGDLDGLLEQLVGGDATDLSALEPQAIDQLPRDASALLLGIQQA